MPELTISEQSFMLTTLALADTPQTVLDAEAAKIFALFLEREAEFGVHPAVNIDYPDITAPGQSEFLADAARYVAKRAAAMSQASLGVRVVVLTTYANIVGASLQAAGYQALPIDMPAGPAHTAAFVRKPTGSGPLRRTLYVEAVNETDEKIRPAFVVKLTDASGRLCAGACGSIHTRQGKRYAYLATMALASDMPAGSGTSLAGHVLQFLKDEGVSTLHLGTQTAAKFYEKLGFKVDHRLVRHLRVRENHGQEEFGDLVMLSKDL